jgi:hypothetical protein
MGHCGKNGQADDNFSMAELAGVRVDRVALSVQEHEAVPANVLPRSRG